MSVTAMNRVYIWCRAARAVGVMHLTEGWAETLGGPMAAEVVLLEWLALEPAGRATPTE